jgi:hypothetical protein
MNHTRIGLVLAAVLACSFVVPCHAQGSSSLVSSSLVEAPTPVESGATAQPGDPGGPMGVYPVERAPEASEKGPRLNALDWSMLGAAASLRVLDFTSTEKALSEPQYFHEAILPQALVKNKPAFAAFQAGTVALNYEAYRLLVRHHMRSLAQVSQYVYVGAMTFQVAHNYQLLGDAPAN